METNLCLDQVAHQEEWVEVTWEEWDQAAHPQVEWEEEWDQVVHLQAEWEVHHQEAWDQEVHLQVAWDQVAHPQAEWEVHHQVEIDQEEMLHQEDHPQAEAQEIFSVTHLNEKAGVHLLHVFEKGNTNRFRPYYQKLQMFVAEEIAYLVHNQILAKFFWPSYKKATKVWQTRADIPVLLSLK